MVKVKTDEVDGTITDPDQAQRVAVTDARHITAPLGSYPQNATWATAQRLAGMVLWLHSHLSNGGVWPTAWAIDATAVQVDPPLVTDVPMPDQPAPISLEGDKRIDEALVAAAIADRDGLASVMTWMSDPDLEAAETILARVLTAVRSAQAGRPR